MILEKLFTLLNKYFIPHLINKSFCLRQINTVVYPLYIEIQSLHLPLKIEEQYSSSHIIELRKLCALHFDRLTFFLTQSLCENGIRNYTKDFVNLLKLAFENLLNTITRSVKNRLYI